MTITASLPQEFPIFDSIRAGTVKKRCPNLSCRKELNVNPDEKTITCPNCDQTFFITKCLSDTPKMGRAHGIRLSPGVAAIRVSRDVGEREILDCIKSLKEPYQGKIADCLEMDRNTLKRRLQDLLTQGKVRTYRKGKFTFYEVLERSQGWREV